MPGFRVSASRLLGRAIAMSVLGVGIEWRESRESRNIDQAIAALSNASALVAELEQDLTQRAVDLNRLKDEYEHYSQLARTEEGAAKALLSEVEKSVGRGLPKERTIAAAINVAAGVVVFALGIVVERYLLS